MTVDVRPLTGADLEQVLPDVAHLRMDVFRAFPYLYDGTFEYEHRYLQSYRESEGAILIGAFDGKRLVGAATGTPLADHADDFAAAFEGQPYDIADIFYCAESVLLPEYRGRGIGHRFFDLREAHAQSLGASHIAFCRVIRAANHPDRPAGYQPLDPFWRKRGYAPLEGAIARYSWTDMGDSAETEKGMQFWIRAL